MVTVILTIVWILILSGIAVTSYLLRTTLSSGKMMQVLEDAERIGGDDFVSDYPTFVNRLQIIRKGAKHPKRYCVEHAAIRFQREYKIMQNFEEKKSSRHFTF